MCHFAILNRIIRIYCYQIFVFFLSLSSFSGSTTFQNWRACTFVGKIGFSLRWRLNIKIVLIQLTQYAIEAISSFRNCRVTVLLNWFCCSCVSRTVLSYFVEALCFSSFEVFSFFSFIGLLYFVVTSGKCRRPRIQSTVPSKVPIPFEWFYQIF